MKTPVVSCGPVAWVREAPLLPGTGTTQCRGCSDEVYVSPSTVKFLVDEPRAVVLCIPCAQKLEAVEGRGTWASTAAQREELERAGLPKGFLEDFLDFMNNEKEDQS